MLYHVVRQHHHVYLILYHGMFHLVTTCDQLLLRQAARLCCINLDGHVIYRYDIPGFLGLAVDQQGHVCISDYYSHYSYVYLVVLCIVSSVDKLYWSLIWKSNYCFICTWYYSNTLRFTGKRYFIFIGLHQQIEDDISQTLTEFIKEDEIKLKSGQRYDLSDMAVTSDNKLLLCNRASSHHKVYIYKDCRVICDNDPIVSMLTFLISLNSMSISLIAEDMSWIFFSVFWMIVICFV
jgi:hypothetical protein